MRREPPYAEMWSGWPRRLGIGSGAVGLILTLVWLATEEGSPMRWQLVSQGLLLAVLSLLGPLNPWRLARVAGTILAGIGTLLIVTVASTDPRPFPDILRWFLAISLGGFTVMGAVSLWRPKVLLGDSDRARKRLSPASARRIVVALTIVSVALVVIVVALLIWIYLGQDRRDSISGGASSLGAWAPLRSSGWAAAGATQPHRRHSEH